MSLRNEQVAFTRDLVKLLQFAEAHEFEITLGEVWRPLEMQKLYVQQGRSKTMKSPHLNRLAADLNVFKAGQLCSAAEIKSLGQYWESLHPYNRWGGSWRGLVEAGKSKFVDSPHFERFV